MRAATATRLLPWLVGLAGAQLELHDGVVAGDGGGDRARYAAVPLTPEGMMPRFVADRARPQLARRDGNCGVGFHNCKSRCCCSAMKRIWKRSFG